MAVEVEDVRPDRMLFAKLQAIDFGAFDGPPKQAFRKAKAPS
jgi:hypothetical protein